MGCLVEENGFKEVPVVRDDWEFSCFYSHTRLSFRNHSEGGKTIGQLRLQTAEFNLPVTSRLHALDAAKMYCVQWSCCV